MSDKTRDLQREISRRLYYGASDIPLSGKGEEELRKLAAEGIYPAAEEAGFVY